MRKGKQILFFALLFSLLGVLSAFAAVCETPVPVTSIQTLLRWYNDGAENAPEMCELTQEIAIDTTVVLDGPDRIRDIGAVKNRIRIKNKGRLVLNNPSVFVEGPGLLIEVEQGGTLELNQGAFYTAPDETSVLVRKGGILRQSGRFNLNGSRIVQEGMSLVPPGGDTGNSILPPDNSGQGEVIISGQNRRNVEELLDSQAEEVQETDLSAEPSLEGTRPGGIGPEGAMPGELTGGELLSGADSESADAVAAGKDGSEALENESDGYIVKTASADGTSAAAAATLIVIGTVTLLLKKKYYNKIEK